MKTLLRMTLGLILVVGAIGCGKRCAISGTVTRDGQPLEWTDEGGHLLVLFIPEDRKADPQVYRADTDRDTGAFRIARIPAGRYLVAIQQFDERHRDALGHGYNPSATPLRYQVSGDGQAIEIDLPKVLPRVASPGGPRRGGKKDPD